MLASSSTSSWTTWRFPRGRASSWSALSWGAVAGLRAVAMTRFFSDAESCRTSSRPRPREALWGCAYVSGLDLWRLQVRLMGCTYPVTSQVVICEAAILYWGDVSWNDDGSWPALYAVMVLVADANEHTGMSGSRGRTHLVKRKRRLPSERLNAYAAIHVCDAPRREARLGPYAYDRLTSVCRLARARSVLQKLQTQISAASRRQTSFS